jgi:hypothetical protein
MHSPSKKVNLCSSSSISHHPRPLVMLPQIPWLAFLCTHLLLTQYTTIPLQSLYICHIDFHHASWEAHSSFKRLPTFSNRTFPCNIDVHAATAGPSAKIEHMLGEVEHLMWRPSVWYVCVSKKRVATRYERSRHERASVGISLGCVDPASDS